MISMHELGDLIETWCSPIKKRLLILALMSAFLQQTGCNRTPEVKKSDVPNVVLITLDTTRADHLGCYGYRKDTSPNIDALSRDGVRFDMAIAQAASTPTSHASILTGLYPFQHGVRVIYARSGYRLPDRVETIATILSTAGWNTGAFLSSFTVSNFYGFGRGFDEFDEGLAHSSEESIKPNPAGKYTWDHQSDQRRSDKTTDAALAWMSSATRPFMAWVHYWDPHDKALLPPPEFVERFKPEGPTQHDKWRALYDAEISFVDSQVGRLVAYLKESGEYENSIFVIVGDHGQGLGDHGWWYHRILYQEDIRVPLVMKYPSGPRGRVVPALVRTIDLLPTVLDTLKIKTPAPLTGLSLLGLISGKQEAPRLAYADALNLYDLNAELAVHRPLDDLVYCRMDQKWKLVFRPQHIDQSELFNLDEDPRELKNLYNASHPEVLRLKADLDQLDGYVKEPFGPGYDQQITGRLNSLGYVSAGSATSAPVEGPTSRPGDE